MDLAEQKKMVDECIALEAKMTDVEQRLIDACERELFVGRTLTVAQEAHVEELWRRLRG